MRLSLLLLLPLHQILPLVLQPDSVAPKMVWKAINAIRIIANSISADGPRSSLLRLGHVYSILLIDSKSHAPSLGLSESRLTVELLRLDMIRMLSPWLR